MKVTAIDPGTTQSAYVRMDDERLLAFGIEPNEWIADYLRTTQGRVVIEKVASYGMPVGAEVFETVWWTGIFTEAAGGPDFVTRITRKQVANHLCNGGEREKGKNPNDSTVRQSLIDRYGGDSAIKKGGALYGVSKDVWAALAVGCAYLDGLK